METKGSRTEFALRVSLHAAHATWVRGCVVAGLLSGCGGSSPPRPLEPPASVASAPAVAPAEPVAEAPPKDGDAAAELLINALKSGDFARATSTFDARLAAALPESKLVKLWSAMLAEVGQLRSWTFTQRDSAPGMERRVASLEFEKRELNAVVTIDSTTKQVVGLFFEPPKPALAAAPYVDSSAFSSEDVTVGTKPFELSGVLSLPNGSRPVPVAVLVHGSGPQDKNEAIGANVPFKNLAEGLASRGIAVLRYDKRTFQYRGQPGLKPTIDDEVVLDAIAAVGLLKSRKEIDASRVFVIGHSLGALLAPEIGLRSAPVAGVVLLAPPARAPWDAVIAQMRVLGAPANRIAEVERDAALLAADKLGPKPFLGAPASYWRDWGSRDGIATARKLRKPMLLLRGERDYQVTSEELQKWKDGLRGLPGVEAVTIAGSNHLFIRGEGASSSAEYDVPGYVDELVIDKVATFISKTK